MIATRGGAAAGAAPALARLRDRLAREERLIVAFSGGADSALLAWAAHDVLGANAVAATAVSASLPARERRAAKAFAARYRIPHVEIATDELDRAEYRANDARRCFHCKTALFDALAPLAAALGAPIALGTNLDDLGDYRPGLRAARLRAGIAPLVDAGLSKADVRAVSAEAGLETSDKPAAACLASRIPYGEPVSAELLARIERAEDALHRHGLTVCRVRAHGGGTLARIEVPVEDLDELLRRRGEIDAELRECGFVHVAVDLAGFRSGSLNALLPLGRTRP
ncbi:ATP-dependent sacrificial sulfur transferase LarE [Dactylosporangium sp. CA-092794]|uniref:ATP-dependent sacrificial sulfur transferase LarE n=1 Tax=Dactylosporangium sp. CA-092794 TaxID=3239929 RepID=UPI003D8AEC90